MKHFIKIMFNLQGLKITKKSVNEKDKIVEIHCESYAKTALCSFCLKRTNIRLEQ